MAIIAATIPNTRRIGGGRTRYAELMILCARIGYNP
jgi:hypothetical protein